MKRISYWVLSTVSLLVLLFGYHTSTAGSLSASTSIVSPISTTGGGGSNSSGSNGSSSGSGGSSGGGSGSGSSSSSGPSTVTGAAAQTRYGPVQVQITVDNGKISNVSVLQYPYGSSVDAQINSYALPILIRETTSAQSAHIDMVSGATFTSNGYLQSLQSALDQAGL